MMDPQGPPLHYPRPNSSLETERTIAGSAPTSPREEVSNHVFEGEPPLYGEAQSTTAQDEKARKKERRTTCIKFATSIFIAVIVCLVAAAVIGKIHENQARKYAASPSTTSGVHTATSTTSTRLRVTLGVDFGIVTSTPTSTMPSSSTIRTTGSSFTVQSEGDERMAADENSTAAGGATTAPPNNGSNEAKPAESRPGNGQAGGKRGPAGNKRRGDKGRNEWSREKQDRRNNNEDYREWKRRKTDKSGNSVDAGDAYTNPFSKEEIAAEERRPKKKVAVMIGYAGTGYKGMQLNGEEKTIERDLFQAFIAAGAISKANADDPRKSSLARCARTDKGVHAAGNVISLKLIIEDEDVVEKINANLPEQIRVWGINRTNNSYNCYQLCDSRWYEYLMPSYCLLPPHPNTFLGKRVAELNKEYGAEDEVNARLADVKDFWTEVEEKEIKPILAGLPADIKAKVLERVHVEDIGNAESGEGKEADEGEAKPSDTPAEQSKPEVEAGSVPEGSFKPKHRELDAVDFALRDIKSAYISAKRRYRVSKERLQQLQAALDKYEGTNNFHNYTVQKAFSDPSAKRHIKSFVVNPEPIIIGDTEWLSLKVHGQSFMMHQIRKMVGLVSLLVRCGTTLDRIPESYRNNKMAIPKAPGLGLLLERPVFENYNRRATESLGKEPIDFAKYDDELQKFKQKEIYTRIFEVEEKESSFHSFFSQIDQFKSNHFLWLSAGGLAVADLKSGEDSKTQEEVDKQLGDEDEDPEGGEG
ncbi:tRNA pseudouridine synthase 1 [Paramyrothecium foliicola]|nr:tRNA pseudouridine synthase 1 [Paramyrothecium foliicola]